MFRNKGRFRFRRAADATSNDLAVAKVVERECPIFNGQMKSSRTTTKEGELNEHGSCG